MWIMWDEIESTFRHDFKSCKCENIYVDGGHDYQRFGYDPSRENGTSSIWSNEKQKWAPIEQLRNMEQIRKMEQTIKKYKSNVKLDKYTIEYNDLINEITELRNELTVVTAQLEAIQQILDLETPSDFMLSFGVVRRVRDLVNEYIK